MKNKAWIAFWLTGIIWGSSFMFISIGVKELRPVEVVFIRTAIAAAGLLAVTWLRKIPIPTDWQTWRSLLMIGIGNVVIPYLLITWSEQYISSGLAAVMQATTALFALIIAHFAFRDERITPQKLIGLVTSFAGIVILFGDQLSTDNPNALGGMFGMVLASLSYAIFTSMSRGVLQRNVPPIIVAGASMLVAALATAPLSFLADGGFTPLTSLSSETIIAMLLLGALNTFIAYLFYYYVVAALGVAVSSMVTYVVPPVGVLLGILFLNEPVSATLIIGGTIIFAGIGIVNIRRHR